MHLERKFQPIYTEPIDLTEDDAHTNDLLINNLVTQNTRRPSLVANEYPYRDLLHHQIKKATTSIVPATHISIATLNLVEKRMF